MLTPRAMLVVVCASALAACGQSAEPACPHADITNIKNVRSSFGPAFQVTDVGPTGIDPRLLGPQTLPPGMKFEPPNCAKFAAQQMVPTGTKGNMAAATAEGEGNRFIAIAVETSEAVPVDAPAQNCHKVGFAGSGVRGLVEVVEAPHIGGAHTLGTRRILQTTVDGQPRTGELYNYVATSGTLLVIVTANPLVVPDKPIVPVNTQRARDLLTAAIAAVTG